MNIINYNLEIMINKISNKYYIPKSKLKYIKNKILKDIELNDIKFTKKKVFYYKDVNNNNFILINSNFALKIK